MSAKNIGRLVNEFIADGGQLDLIWGDNNQIQIGSGAGAGVGDAQLYWDGTQLILSPTVDDSTWAIGNGTLSWDVKLFGSAAANYISWDASANDLKLEDSVSLMFGTGATAGPGTAGDVEVRWDGTDLDVLAAADDLIIKWGNGTNSFDQWWYGNAASTYFSWDASADRLKFEDNVAVGFGTGSAAGPGAAGDYTFTFDATILSLIPTADDLVFKIGNGTLSSDLWIYGNIVTSYVEFDASTDQLGLFGPQRPRGFNKLPRRYELKWVAGARGKPGINADIQNAAESVRMIADPDFEVLGVNATTASVTRNTDGGGIVLTCAGVDGDEVIILPHLDTDQTNWASTLWGTENQVSWEAHIKTGSNNNVATIIWAGLKLTNTEVTATDNDQAFFRYEDDVNGAEWQAIYSIGGVDTAVDTNVAVANSTEYHLLITIDSSRVARFYINGVLVATSTALTNSVDLIPYIGLANDGVGGAKVMRVYGQSISRVAQ